MTEEQKKQEFEEWQNRNIKWLHFQISIGKIGEIIERAFLEAMNIGFAYGIKTKVNTTTISDAPLEQGYVWDYMTQSVMKIDPEEKQTEKCLPCKYNTVGQDEYIWGLEEQQTELKEQIEKLKKCLRGVVYMVESGVSIKNELAFARLISDAKDLLKED